jgi:hypothetical protein
MTDVRERVARAIATVVEEPVHWKLWLEEADAALSAINYEEIVGALADLLANYEAAVHQLHGTSGNNEFESEDERIIAAARAALRKARGENIMSDKINDGPAFPTTAPKVDDKGQSHWSADAGGMSLRDYFAGQVLAGMMTKPSIIIATDNVANIAYNIADAMLVERAKRDVP